MNEFTMKNRGYYKEKRANLIDSFIISMVLQRHFLGNQRNLEHIVQATL